MVASPGTSSMMSSTIKGCSCMCSITLKQHEQYSTWRKSLMGSCIYVYIRVQGCQWKSQKNVELHFVVSLCVRCTHAKPEGANTEGETHYLLGYRWISEVFIFPFIFWCKKRDFHRRLVSLDMEYDTSPLWLLLFHFNALWHKGAQKTVTSLSGPTVTSSQL